MSRNIAFMLVAVCLALLGGAAYLWLTMSLGRLERDLRDLGEALDALARRVWGERG